MLFSSQQHRWPPHRAPPPSMSKQLSNAAIITSQKRFAFTNTDGFKEFCIRPQHKNIHTHTHLSFETKILIQDQTQLSGRHLWCLTFCVPLNLPWFGHLILSLPVLIWRSYPCVLCFALYFLFCLSLPLLIVLNCFICPWLSSCVWLLCLPLACVHFPTLSAPHLPSISW